MGLRFGNREIRRLQFAQEAEVPLQFVVPVQTVLSGTDEQQAEFEVLPEMLAQYVPRSILADPVGAIQAVRAASEELTRRGATVLRPTLIYALAFALTHEGGPLTPTEYESMEQIIRDLRDVVPQSQAEFERLIQDQLAAWAAATETDRAILSAWEGRYQDLPAPIEPTSVTIDRADARFQLLRHDRPISTDNILDVFAELVRDGRLSLVTVRSGDKLFNAVTVGFVPPTIREPKRQADRRRGDYLSLGLVVDGRYYVGTWSPDGYLIFPEVEWALIPHLAKSLTGALGRSGLQIQQLPSTMLSGSATYALNEWRPWTWLGLVITDPLFDLIYINEAKTAAALAPSWNFVYRDDQLINFRLRSVGGLTVSFHRAATYGAAQRLINLLSHLLPIVETSGWPDLYAQAGLTDPVSTPEARTPAARARLLGLREVDAEVFGPGYSGECMGRRQPVIVPPEDQAAVEAETFIRGNATYTRQVMPFPLDRPRYLIACPVGEHPFPGIVLNRSESGDRHPYLPCCFAHDEMNDSRSLYNQQLGALESPTEGKGGRGVGLVRTRKAVQPGQHGEIGGAAPALFAKISGLPAITIQRVGLPVDQNTMLAGILFATSGRLPSSADAARERRRIADGFRKGTWPLAALSQEQPDQSDEERLAYLDGAGSLNTDRWIRLADLVYNVNLAVLVISKEKAQRETERFELPQSVGPYVRYWDPERPTVILVTNPALAVEAPIYDLLAWSARVEDVPVARSERSARLRADQYIFPAEASAALQAELLEMEPIWSWRPGQAAPVRNALLLDNTLNGYFNKVASDARAQLIDSFGKCRGVETPLGLVYLPPAAPLPLPRSKQEYKVGSLEPWIKLFGAPTSVGAGGAFWATDYFPEGVYVPGDSTTLDVSIPLTYVPPPDLSPGAQPPPTRYYTLKRQAHFIQQLVMWLIRADPSVDQKTFVSRYLLTPPTTGPADSATAYDFGRVPRELPTEETLAASLRAAAQWRTGLITADGLLPYSSDFRRAMVDLIRDTYRNSRAQEAGPVRYIRDYYTSASDFPTRSDVVVLSGPGQLAQWIEQMTSNDYMTTYTEVPLSPTGTRPYLLRYQIAEPAATGLVLVQNVEGGSRARALAVAQEWSRHVNLGYRAAPLEELPSADVYTYNTSTHMMEVAEVATSEGASLLRYPDGSYAAMLALTT